MTQKIGDNYALSHCKSVGAVSGLKYIVMALNVNALIPTLEHPEVTSPIVEDQARAGADKEKGFDPKHGGREKALAKWEEDLTKLKRGNHLQLLDVL